MLIQMLSYPFIIRALIVGILVSVCAALLGVSLVLKRFSMIGDGLSHVGFGSLAIATATGAAPLAVSIPIVGAAAFILLRITEKSRIRGDAAIALISTSALAIGVIIISLTTGMNMDVNSYMFGSILATTAGDVWLSAAISAVVLALFALFYNRIFAVTFDETFARASGLPVRGVGTLLALLTAVTIVIGMRIMGALLITSLLIFPALTSMRIFKKFRSVMICSGIIAPLCVITGMLASFGLNLPTGASIVAANLIVFAVFSAIGRIGPLFTRARS
jgi:zinc transport system permease protein